jgi:hypothetical protein
LVKASFSKRPRLNHTSYMKSTTPVKEKGRTLFKESLRVYDAKSESWKDGIAQSAKSDGTVKYRNNGAIVSIGMVKQPTAPTAKLLTRLIILFKISNINYYRYSGEDIYQCRPICHDHPSEIRKF